MSRPPERGVVLLSAALGLVTAVLELLTNLLGLAARVLDLPVLSDWLHRHRVLVAISTGLLAASVAGLIHRRVRAAGGNDDIADLPPRNRGFAGRVHLFARLDRLVVARPVRPVILYGPDGVGTTQLALEFAHRSKRYSLRWWIPAEGPTHIVGALTGLASNLGLSTEAGPAGTVAAVRRELGRRREWLLVFDNADDPADVFPYLPSRGRGHAVITSRNPAWTRRAHNLPVSRFAPEEARAFLLDRAGRRDTGAAADLAEELHRLPLALALAAGSLRQAPAMTLEAYLQSYRQHRQRQLQDGQLAETDLAAVAIALRVSVQQVEARVSDAADLLRVCAFLAPEMIPYDLLAIGAGELPQGLRTAVLDPDGFDRMSRILEGFCLIDRDRSGIRLHPLIQRAVRDSLDEQNATAWRRRAVRLVLTAFPDTPADPEHGQRLARLRPHALATARHAAAVAPYATREILSGLAVQLGNNGRSASELSEAFEHLQEVLQLVERCLSPEHPTVASVLITIGATQGKLGRLAEAQSTLERAVRILEASCRYPDPRIAGALNNLGMVLHRRGDLARAREVLERAVQILETAYGRDCPGATFELANLGAVTADMGELGTARDMLERVLRTEQATYGPDHVEVARTLRILGSVMHRQDELLEAWDRFDSALRILALTYGPGHPEFALASIELGTVLVAHGRVPAGWQYLWRGTTALLRQRRRSVVPTMRRSRQSA